MRLLAVLLALCSGCMTAQRWGQRALLAEAMAVTYCDRGQTQWMADGGKYDRHTTEADPVLGTTPSPMRINLTNVAALGGEVAGYAVLPNKLRWAFLIGVAVLETANVVTNPVHAGEHRPFCGGGAL